MLSSPAPHIKSKLTVRRIMGDVLIALTPALITGCYFFGLRCLLITAVSIAVCVLSEAAFELISGKKLSIGDLSAAVTGMLIALNMSSLTPLWVVAIAGVFSVVIVKQLFGGIGSNVLNPALMGRLFVMVAYPSSLMKYTEPLTDALSSATVLSGGSYELIDMIIGKVPGAIGETGAIALLVGFVFLLIRGDVKLAPSAIYILLSASLCALFKADFLTSLFSGGLLLGGFFMLTDYPAGGAYGRTALAVVAAVLTALIRCFTSFPEGVCYAILITNMLSGIFDKFITPKIYGLTNKQL